MKCSVCDGRAVIKIAYAGVHLCEKHFSSYFEQRFLETIRLLRMVERGERVAVAVSGGKDSLALLYLMSKYSDALGVEIVAVLADEGIRGYREEKARAAEAYAKKWSVELVVRSFREEFGFTLDEAVSALMADGLKYKPCTVCGVFRRYVLNRVALELGADKLATAHNLDDEAQAFLMNAIQANLPSIAREGPRSGRIHEKLVPRVKPLYFIPEKEVLAYALLSGIESPQVECPYIVYSLRHQLRRWLNEVAEQDPGVKHRVIALKNSLAPLFERGGSFRSCRACGMPSSGEVCKTCWFKQYIARLLASRQSACCAARVNHFNV